MTVVEILTLLTLVATVVGFVIAWLQLRANQKSKIAEFLYTLVEKLRCDENVATAMYQIDYGKPWYDHGFIEPEKEKDFDALFSLLDYVCYLKKKNSKNDAFAVFDYKLSRVCSNSDFQKYMGFIDPFSNAVVKTNSKKQNKNQSKSSFPNLIEYFNNYQK